MEIFAFISKRDEIYVHEHSKANDADIKLVHIGCPENVLDVDWKWVMDAWFEHYKTLTGEQELDYEACDSYQFDGVIVDHPAVALNLITETAVGVFDITTANGNISVNWLKLFE
jgi:hypothetical protein